MIAALALVLAVQQPPAAPAAADSFPHALHRRLFTSCTSCHAGVVTGNRAAVFPDPLTCRSCHDGETQDPVFWTPRAEPRPTTLRFRHADHAAMVEGTPDSAMTCAACHALADRTAGLMAVGRARPENCIACHAHEAPSHLAQASCTPCHRTGAAMAPEAVAAFPKPPSHVAGYDQGHAREAQSSRTCGVCHAREFCASCHVNADRVEAIRALPSDPRTAAALAARPVTYRAPETHGRIDFLRSHGGAAQDGIARCATCHTRESCLDCHRDQSRVRVITELPRRTASGAPGVTPSRRRPPDHTPRFAGDHRTVAAAGDASCARCHEPTFCSTCHDGARAPNSFHGFNYVQRHGQSAWTPDAECSACHQTQAFCVQCHRQVGVASTQARGNRFHDAGGFWFLGHGAAARRSLETCTTCHAQTFCMQCHSARTAIRVNPHGPGFDRSMGERNPTMCRMCHPGGAPSP